MKGIDGTVSPKKTVDTFQQLHLVSKQQIFHFHLSKQSLSFEMNFISLKYIIPINRYDE